MGAKFQGLTISLIGVVALLSGLGIENLGGSIVKTVANTTTHMYTPIGFYLEMFGIALIVVGIAWAVIGSRHTVGRG